MKLKLSYFLINPSLGHLDSRQSAGTFDRAVTHHTEGLESLLTRYIFTCLLETGKNIIWITKISLIAHGVCLGAFLAPLPYRINMLFSLVVVATKIEILSVDKEIYLSQDSKWHYYVFTTLGSLTNAGPPTNDH